MVLVAYNETATVMLLRVMFIIKFLFLSLNKCFHSFVANVDQFKINSQA